MSLMLFSSISVRCGISVLPTLSSSTEGSTRGPPPRNFDVFLTLLLNDVDILGKLLGPSLLFSPELLSELLSLSLELLFSPELSSLLF